MSENHSYSLAIGSDHAGYDLKQHLIGHLGGLGHRVTDHGTHSTESVDYPPICAEVARSVRDGKVDFGIVLGGSGQGEQIAANKVRGVRAALCNDLYLAEMARSHNNANVLSMGGRVVSFELAVQIVATFCCRWAVESCRSSSPSRSSPRSSRRPSRAADTSDASHNSQKSKYRKEPANAVAITNQP